MKGLGFRATGLGALGWWNQAFSVFLMEPEGEYHLLLYHANCVLHNSRQNVEVGIGPRR